MYSGCHPRDVLPLIYTGASCIHIFDTAGTSGSVEGQYAILCHAFKNRWGLMQYMIPTLVHFLLSMSTKDHPKIFCNLLNKR